MEKGVRYTGAVNKTSPYFLPIWIKLDPVPAHRTSVDRVSFMSAAQ